MHQTPHALCIMQVLPGIPSDKECTNASDTEVPPAGLLCLRTAKEGGLTSWSSSGAIYNRMLHTHPDYVKVTSAPVPCPLAVVQVPTCPCCP